MGPIGLRLWISHSACFNTDHHMSLKEFNNFLHFPNHPDSFCDVPQLWKPDPVRLIITTPSARRTLIGLGGLQFMTLDRPRPLIFVAPLSVICNAYWLILFLGVMIARMCVGRGNYFYCGVPCPELMLTWGPSYFGI